MIRPGSKSREKSNETELEERSKTPNDIEGMKRQVSFSNYQILPPINDDNKEIDDKTKSKGYESCMSRTEQNAEISTDKLDTGKNKMKSEEMIELNEGKQHHRDNKKQQDFQKADKNQNSSVRDGRMKADRTLYRKGDIFKKSNISSSPTLVKDKSQDNRITVKPDVRSSLFRVSAEPDESIIGRIHLAFRIPDRSRLERFFLPTDRVGDVDAFLKSFIFSQNERKSTVELSVNDFPRRTLDSLDTTLEDANVKDRTLIDVMICDSPGVT